MQMEYLATHAEMTSHHQEGDGLGRTAAARSSTQQQRRLIHPGETPCGILKRQLLPMPVTSRLPHHLLRLGMPALLLR